jgi:SAM-dependent methyltransferase
MLRNFLKRLHKPVYDRRLEELVRLLAPHLQSGYRVLDAGCGFGQLGRALMDAVPGCRVEGVERAPRGGELIPVSASTGDCFPWPDSTFDVVIVADVLHHDAEPDRLLAECARVSRHLVIVKDHLREGFLAQQRICLLDWAANVPYGVPCTFRYKNLSEWRQSVGLPAFRVLEERTSIDIYPPVLNQVLGKGLHYLAVLERQPALITG